LKNDNRYKRELITFLQFLVKTVYEQKPDYLFWAGDAFDKDVPTPEEYTLFHTVIKQISDYGTKIIMTQGNHDEPDNAEAHHTLNPIKALKIPNVFILDELDVYTLPGIDVLALPYKYHDKEECKLKLQELHNNYAGQNLYFIGHCWVEGGMGVAPPASEFVIPLGVLATLPKVKYGALGHIHIAGNVFGQFFYSGSPYRTTWGEEEPSKCMLMYDSDTGVTSQLLTPAIPMHIFDVRTYTEDDLNRTGQMVKIRAVGVDVSLLPKIEELKTLLESRGNYVYVEKKVNTQYVSATADKKDISVEGYIAEYVKNNDVVPYKATLNAIVEKIISGEIKSGASPFNISELGLEDKDALA